MSWDTYNSRLTVNGETERDRRKYTLTNRISGDAPMLLTGKVVTIFSPNSTSSKEQTLTIISSDKNNKKDVMTIPGETIECGAIIEWSDAVWLVTEVDADKEIYQSAFIERCNYVLKFKNKDGDVISKNCIIASVAQSSVGEDVGATLVTGNSLKCLIITKDLDTIKLKRGFRFIVDDVDSSDPTVYEITNLDRVTGRYSGDGIYKYIIKEANTLPDDNLVDHIPSNDAYIPNTPNGKEGWF